jgi:hypothetical protein
MKSINSFLVTRTADPSSGLAIIRIAFDPYEQSAVKQDERAAENSSYHKAAYAAE